MSKIIIGQQLKHLRKSRALTQDQVSERVGISRSTISNYEHGRRLPHLKDLRNLADVYGVGLDYFGISPKDEAFELLSRAKDVFYSTDIDDETKENLYLEFMELYVEIKKLQKEKQNDDE